MGLYSWVQSVSALTSTVRLRCFHTQSNNFGIANAQIMESKSAFRGPLKNCLSGIQRVKNPGVALSNMNSISLATIGATITKATF